MRMYPNIVLKMRKKVFLVVDMLLIYLVMLGGGSFVLFDLVCLAKGLSSDFYVTVTFHLGKFLW